MSKPLTFVLLLMLSVVCAGVFGALHNQLSYSIGASYFHEVKFAQFDIAEDLRNRLGAALVGWRASWWMGVLIGLPAFALGLATIVRPTHLLAAGVGAIGAVLMVTLLCAMGGLLFALLGGEAISETAAHLPPGVVDKGSFMRAAYMHEGAYLGGMLGLLAALWTVWRASRMERQVLRPAS